VTNANDLIAGALPNYVIGEEVGRGAWGVVIKGEHRRLGRQVAIKQLPTAFAADPGVQRRFASEARLLASLDHPHIVPIFDYVEEDQLCLLVMELLPGGTVWDRVTTEGVTAEKACSIVLATCSALHYAHGKGILHRDIKPENLLFGAAGALKVTDFGIAKVLGGVETYATRTGEVLGTPAYIAPEQALARELTPATDVYAVGTLLYELLSGQLPFADDGNAIGLLYRHVHEPPTPLLDVAPTIPQPVAEATMKALATDPADRYPTAEDFGAAVAEAASGGWGSDWVQRAGLSVMASGEIAARISGGARPGTTEAAASETAGAPETAGAKTAGGVDGGAEETPTRPAPVRTTRSSGAPPAAVGAAAPQDLVTVQDMLAEEPSELRQTPRAGEPAAGQTQAIGAPPPQGTVPTAEEPARRSRWRIILPVAVGVIVVGVGAGIAVTQLGSGGGSPSSTNVSVAARPGGQQVFSDNFANSKSGWAPDAGQNGGTAAYVNGGYEVTVSKTLGELNTYSVASPYMTKLTNMASSVNATLVEGSTIDGAGVRCDEGGSQARNNLRYTFQVNADRSWVIFKLAPNEPNAALLQGTMSPAIRGGSATNAITGQCTEVGDGATRLVMTVNGTVIGSVTDTHGGSPVPWHTALTVYRSMRSTTSPQTVVRFTNFATFNVPPS
jgi:serine/threonine-protein kinase